MAKFRAIRACRGRKIMAHPAIEEMPRFFACHTFVNTTQSARSWCHAHAQRPIHPMVYSLVCRHPAGEKTEIFKWKRAFERGRFRTPRPILPKLHRTLFVSIDLATHSHCRLEISQSMAVEFAPSPNFWTASFVAPASKCLHDIVGAVDFYHVVAVVHTPSCTMLISMQIGRIFHLKFDFDVDMIDLSFVGTFQLKYSAGLLMIAWIHYRCGMLNKKNRIKRNFGNFLTKNGTNFENHRLTSVKWQQHLSQFFVLNFRFRAAL